MNTEQFAEEPRSEGTGDDVRARVADLEHRARTAIRQRPIVALSVAVWVGYLTARVVSGARRWAS